MKKLSRFTRTAISWTMAIAMVLTFVLSGANLTVRADEGVSFTIRWCDNNLDALSKIQYKLNDGEVVTITPDDVITTTSGTATATSGQMVQGSDAAGTYYTLDTGASAVGDKVTVWIALNEGYELDEENRCRVIVNGSSLSITDATNVFASQEGYTYQINDQAVHELELGTVSADSGSGDSGSGSSGQTGSNTVIAVGDTAAVDEENQTVLIDTTADTADQVSDDEFTVEGNDIIIDACGDTYAGKYLKITGNGASIRVNGTGSFKGIVLGEGTSVSFWGNGYNGDDDNWVFAQFNLTEGFMGEGSSNMASFLEFRDDIIVNVGTWGSPADAAFKYIEEVEFNNYEFHSRYTVNTHIYSTTPFYGVGQVNVLSAIVVIERDTTLVDNSCMSEPDATVQVFQEGIISFTTSDLGNASLYSKYYDHYPENGRADSEAVDSNGLTGDYIGYESVTIDPYTGYTSCDFNYEDSLYTLVSNDPILYSVAYVVDDSESYPNADCGSVTMDGFEKGYYLVYDEDNDGTEDRFEAWIAAGETVNVTILPEPGYQYIKGTLNINGVAIDRTVPGSNVGAYKFTMPANAGHMCADFAATEDLTVVSSDAGVEDVALADVPDGVVSAGNAELVVDEAVPTSAEQSAILTAASADSSSEATYLDLTFNEYVVQNFDPTAESQAAWETQQTDLSDEVTIEVIADKGATDYQVVRVHDGAVEALDGVTYDPENGVVSFKTDKFSTYALVAKKSSSSGTTDTTKTINKVTYKVSGSSAVVTGFANSAKKVVIKDKVTIGGKSYKVTAIKAKAFAKAKKLTKVTIGANVKTIGKKAFFKASKLKKVIFKNANNLKSVGKNAFKGIKKKASIVVKIKSKAAYKKAVKKLKKAGAKKAKFSFKKKK
ncbi:MAG: leucine-rich repeat domain-containing protein [Eubacterium sp.]|nr:leucine-rich repeat domain-containing protein [Eubacterium sp.]